MKKIIFLVASIALIACSKEEKKNSLELDLTGEMLQVNTQTLIQDDKNVNNYYSQVDSIVKYAYGYRIVLPDSLKEVPLKVIISANIKETEQVTGEFVVSINEPNMNTLFWGNKPVNTSLKQINVWQPYKDSVLILANQNVKQTSHLYIFNYKLVGKGKFLVDDFKVKLIKE